MKRFLGSRFPLLLIMLGGIGPASLPAGHGQPLVRRDRQHLPRRQPLLELLRHTAGDIHPPLYYALLRGWLVLMGYGSGRADPAGIGLEFVRRLLLALLRSRADRAGIHRGAACCRSTRRAELPRRRSPSARTTCGTARKCGCTPWVRRWERW